MIPLLDLQAANEPMLPGIMEAMRRVACSGRYILGPEVEAFENAWGAYCGARYCVGTGNALDALRLILMGLDIGPGDEVLVPSNTYIATWLAVSLVGAVPVPVEPDPATFNIDPARVDAAITPRTRAILAVHLYGRCANMVALSKIAVKRSLPLLVDAAQAHGAFADGLNPSTYCHAQAFSFYPSKNLGGLGDGGAVTTDDYGLAEKIRRLRNYGGVGRLDHTVRGINSRLDELQAAILREKLTNLLAMNLQRQARAKRYFKALEGSDVTLPRWDDGCVWHQFVIRHERRDALQAELARRGVDTHVHYPVPPHLEPAYADLKYRRGDFPIAEQLADEVLSLPIGNEVEVEWIAELVHQAVQLEAA